MSEVDARPTPSRGRSSARGGRGGFSRGIPRGTRKTANDTSADAAAPSLNELLDEQGELGEIKKKYSSELAMLRDMFPDWTDVDLVFALQENDGDIPSTVEKITQGNVSQFSEVKKVKDRARSKVKEDPAPTGTTDKATSRGGRGRGGFEGTRGGRGRASERGRGGFRGARGGHATTNGTPKDASVPTAESTAWETTTAAPAAEVPDKTVNEPATEAAQTAWANVVPAEGTRAAASEGVKSTLIPEGRPKKSWASMFSQPKPAPAPPKQVAPVPKPPPVTDVAAAGPAAPVPEIAPVSEKEAEAAPDVEAPATFTSEVSSTIGSEDIKIAPSKVPLTEENVEHLPDESIPPATHTVVSNAGSTDTRNLTPLPAQSTPTSRPVLGGYAASAYRATGMPTRSASFQRRVKEQQEAVVMPGHNAVDRAAVQFGSMGLNGEPGPDVDEDREEPETRQAPQHSPPSLPRTSLPPAMRQAAQTQEAPEPAPAPKQAPGLPPASTQNQQMMQEAPLGSGLGQDQGQAGSNYNQYGRYGQPGMQAESNAQQKPYDPFSHQAQPSQYDQYGAHAGQQQQQVNQSGFGGLSSAQNDYSSYYTADQRNAYSQYFGNSYGQQDTRGALQPGQQDAASTQQRSASGLGAGPNDSPFSAQAQQQTQSRFGEASASGQNTPNPISGGQHNSGPNAQQSQHSAHQAPSHQQQQQPQGGYNASFPYGHPYYNSPYQQAYQNQFGFSHQQPGYGQGGFPGKQGGMYGVPHGYGMSSQSSFDQHSSSPANASGFGQNQPSSLRSASGMGSGLTGGIDEYGRSSTQPANHQQGAHQQSSGYGSNDPFARSTSGFGTQGYGQQSAASGPEESLKSFNDTKGGPSPALNQPGRPASAANSAIASGPNSLPPPHNQQGNFGGYQGFPGQNNQYGGLGGLGNHQQGQQSGMGGQGGYGGYGAGFGQAYGGYNSRGGWGSNYGAH